MSNQVVKYSVILIKQNGKIKFLGESFGAIFNGTLKPRDAKKFSVLSSAEYFWNDYKDIMRRQNIELIGFEELKVEYSLIC